MDLIGRIVKTDEEVETLRCLRNHGREWMTGDTSEISPEQQRAWWQKMSDAKPAEFLPLLYNVRERVIVGYGILSRRDGKLFVSLGVDPRVRGEGFGTQIYRDLAARAEVLGERCFAVILQDNTSSVMAALRAGYERMQTEGDTFVFASVLEGK